MMEISIKVKDINLKIINKYKNKRKKQVLKIRVLDFKEEK
jgi:hypothetical protein